MKRQICAAALAGSMLMGPAAGAAWMGTEQMPAWLNPDAGAVTTPATSAGQTTGQTSVQTVQGTVVPPSTTASSAATSAPAATSASSAASSSQMPAWLDPNAGAVTAPSSTSSTATTTQTYIRSTGQAAGTPGTVTTNTGDVYPTYWLGFSAEEATFYLQQQDPEIANAEMLSYDQIEPLVRTQNKTVLANRETLAGIEAVDIDEAIDDMEDAIDSMKQGISAMQQLASSVSTSLTTVDPTVQNGAATVTIGSATVALLQGNITQMETQLAQLEDQLDELEDTDYEPYEKQFESIENQLVMAAQAAYIGLMTIQQNYIVTVQQSDLTNVTYNEMQTRFQLGQISQQQLDQARLAKTQTDSAIQSLYLTLRNAKEDLSLMLGRDPARSYMLDTLPAVTPDMLALLDLDTDMARGQEQSYDIYAAEQAVEEAEDLDRDTDGRDEQIRAAEYQLESAEESFQQNFTKLFRAVSENNRLLSVAREALDYQNEVTETQKLKYDLGTISRNAYIEAQVNQAVAESNVKLAQIDLFSAYMQYQWACQGVMGSTGGM